ncbi:UPF0483 protein [Symbiodinium microadriaticum]|uniref:UPF0483 protein n=1 Tax=Symbiodinium microadriaticum TaxID=2951 RepID=A0A1Q9CY59_SYMMI|nr:UPF0483 protein [Symbiodinium microadriaticum]
MRRGLRCLLILALALRWANTAPSCMAQPRLLCLHGKGGNGPNFAERLRPLAERAELVCVDAPHSLPPGFAWWHLPPGERPFDGILGFSQGAILVAALVALGDFRKGGALASCRCLILAGSAVPGPFRRQLADLAGSGDRGDFRALHTIGRSDTMNPPEGAHEVARAVGGEVFEFDGGHEVPLDEAALGTYSSFLSKKP